MNNIFPKQLGSLQVLCELSGSSRPKQVKDPETNRVYVMKVGFNPEHMLNEFRVNLCYLNFGCHIAPTAIYLNDKLSDLSSVESALKSDSVANKVTVLSQFLDNAKTWAQFQQERSKEDCNLIRKEISRHFVLDCLFSNRDVIGSADDNILITENTSSPKFTAYRIDNGGSLSFRAKGEKKEMGEWGEFVSEINLFCDESFNKNTGNMFSQFVNQDSILQQTLDILSNAEIYIFPYLEPNDVQIVQQRLGYLQNILGMFSVSSEATTSNSRETTEANPQLVSSLMEMGFSREQSELALIASNNNIDTALSFLFN